MYLHVNISRWKHWNIGGFYAEKCYFGFVGFYSETSKAFKADKALNAVIFPFCHKILCSFRPIKNLLRGQKKLRSIKNIVHNRRFVNPKREKSKAGSRRKRQDIPQVYQNHNRQNYSAADYDKITDIPEPQLYVGSQVFGVDVGFQFFHTPFFHIKKQPSFCLTVLNNILL